MSLSTKFWHQFSADWTVVVPQETLRYLAFDCLVVDDQNVMTRPLDKRYGVRGLSYLNIVIRNVDTRHPAAEGMVLWPIFQDAHGSSSDGTISTFRVS